MELEKKQLKRNVVVLAVSTSVLTVFMYYLYASSPLTSDVLRGNFRRNFVPAAVPKFLNEVDLKRNSYYIAGIVDSTVYLGNYTRPFLVSMVDLKTMHLSHKHIVTPVGVDSIRSQRYFRLLVTRSCFYLFHGVAPVVLRGATGEWRAISLDFEGGDYFDQAVPVSRSSFAMRYFNRIVDGYSIGKKQTAFDTNFEADTSLLKQQGDGIFSVDGKLHYSDTLRSLIYLYSYRNEYIVADTSLSLLYRGNTIDTISKARVRVAQISKTKSMISGPTLVTNRNSCVSGLLLFVESNLLAKNEDQTTFLQASVIDVYDIKKAKYLYSFYFRNPYNKRISDFSFNDCIGIVIVNDKLLVYDITSDLYGKLLE